MGSKNHNKNNDLRNNNKKNMVHVERNTGIPNCCKNLNLKKPSTSFFFLYYMKILNKKYNLRKKKKILKRSSSHPGI